MQTQKYGIGMSYTVHLETCLPSLILGVSEQGTQKRKIENRKKKSWRRRHLLCLVVRVLQIRFLKVKSFKAQELLTVCCWRCGLAEQWTLILPDHPTSRRE
ncbi:hypothetical protein AA313_de0207889 [Arthrobotrys entomopaga]|nr:hypothetical protein AA313_de0207889 [Arthrobotrys entomopaga]